MPVPAVATIWGKADENPCRAEDPVYLLKDPIFFQHVLQCPDTQHDVD